ncbi:hypothetical protein Tco_0862235, partial [Tanacetum coccineum]
SIQEVLKELIKSHKDELFKTMQSVVEMFRQQEQAANLSTRTSEPSRHFNSICYDDDDDEESTIPLNEIISQITLSVAITPVLPTMEPEDSLIMRDEDLRTIPKKESDKVIKSSVKDLVPIPSESEDTIDNDSECDLPFCDDSSPLDIFSDTNDNFTSSDDESLLEEDIPEENFKIYSKPLFELKHRDSDKECDLPFCDNSVTFSNPLFDANEDECLDPGGDIDEINDFLDIDVSIDIEDGYHDSEGDIIYLESLLFNDTILNLPPKVFLDHDPRSLKDEPDNDDLKSIVKVFDPGIHEKIISPTHVRFPFKDRHYFSLTFVIKIFLPFLTYLVNSLLLLSSESEDTIFDPSISAYSFYSLEPVAYGSPMKIFPFSVSAPRTKKFGEKEARLFLSRVSWLVFYVQDCPDYEDSCARGFVHRSLKLQSFACLYMGIRYPRSY